MGGASRRTAGRARRAPRCCASATTAPMTWWQSDVQLYYYRARWYNAASGRWTSEDPMGFAAGDYNLNRYVGNNPMNATDPSGYKYKFDLNRSSRRTRRIVIELMISYYGELA